MRAVVDIPVTVKCRIGIDDQDPEVALEAFTAAVEAAGADALIVHARKAWEYRGLLLRSLYATNAICRETG